MDCGHTRVINNSRSGSGRRKKGEEEEEEETITRSISFERQMSMIVTMAANEKTNVDDGDDINQLLQ